MAAGRQHGLAECLQNSSCFGCSTWGVSNISPALLLEDAQREVLAALSRSQVASHREVQRAQVLLMASEGLANEWIARVVGVNPGTVRAWRARFAQDGLVKFGAVRAGRGRKPVIPESKIAEIVWLTQNTKPEAETHWSVRSMAARAGVSPAQVQRIWAAARKQPCGRFPAGRGHGPEAWPAPGAKGRRAMGSGARP